MSKIAGLDDLKYGMLDEVRDTVTGYTGKITGVTAYLNGCVQYLIASQPLAWPAPQGLRSRVQHAPVIGVL